MRLIGLAVVLCLALEVLAAQAQPAAKPIRIGLLDLAAAGPSRQPLWDAFRRRLRELGYNEGQHVVFEYRSADGQPNKLADLADELVHLKVDVIVAPSTPAVLAAKRATTTIPIVMTNTADPVNTGLVASLAHPGGNVTGLTSLSAELSAKRLELLREVVPRAARIAVLWDATNPAITSAVRAMQSVGPPLGVQIFVTSAGRTDEIERAISAMVREKVQAVVTMPGPVFLVERKHLAEIIMKYKLPTIFTQREYVESGGLMAYGSSLSDLFARAAQFVDKIAKGARPADLPVEQPTKFELVVNLQTAKALGLTIPQSLLLRADEVIQ